MILASIPSPSDGVWSVGPLPVRQVSTGDTVSAGSVVGTVGSTGNVTGQPLHLEVRPEGGDPVDPVAAMVDRGLYL